MAKSDFDYFKRRLNEERFLAEFSRDPVTARAHRRMAVYYAEKLAELRSRPVSVETSPNAT